MDALKVAYGVDGRETKTFQEARTNLLLECLTTNNMCTDT